MEADTVLGVTTPQLRRLAREFDTLPLDHPRRIMSSGIHEERSLACAILRRRYEKGGKAERARIFDFSALY